MFSFNVNDLFNKLLEDAGNSVSVSSSSLLRGKPKKDFTTAQKMILYRFKMNYRRSLIIDKLDKPVNIDV